MSPRSQIFFVHIPKCAGTSVLKSISRVGNRRLLVLSESPRAKEQAREDLQRLLKSRKQKIEDVDIVFGHDVYHGIHAESTRPPSYCTILRDPVQRYVSHYRYFIDCAKNRKSPIHELAKSEVLAGEKFLSLSECVDRLCWHNVMTNYLASANHPDLSKGRWQIATADEQLRLAIDFIDQMSFVGTVENLNQGMQTICETLGLRFKLDAFNKSKSKISDSGSVSVSVELAKRIRSMNSLDQQVYEYTCHRKVSNANG